MAAALPLPLFGRAETGAVAGTSISGIVFCRFGRLEDEGFAGFAGSGSGLGSG